jgi:uncharacterized protein (DUF488 family)
MHSSSSRAYSPPTDVAGSEASPQNRRGHCMMPFMERTLFTIGHSTHTIDHFLSLLKKHQIGAVCDVRSIPYSQRNPQFNREPIKDALRDTGIAYVFLGKELGARSDNPACYIEGKVQYSCLADEPIFREGLRRLREGIERYRVALMCAERDPLTCHRTILVCRKLRGPGLTIEHILADGSIESNSAAELRLMSLMNIQPDMIHDKLECIERAYESQANKIAYVIPNFTPDRSSQVAK